MIADRRRGTGLAVAALLLGLAGGCAAPGRAHDGPCAADESAAIDDLLYFGLSRPGGRVDAAEWSAFLRDVVTPRFPAGLSTWPVAGQWRRPDGTIDHEDAVALSIVHPDDAASDDAIRFIASDYKRRYRQEAVLRVRRRACLSF